jgi:hypothetical protein
MNNHDASIASILMKTGKSFKLHRTRTITDDTQALALVAQSSETFPIGSVGVEQWSEQLSSAAVSFQPGSCRVPWVLCRPLVS